MTARLDWGLLEVFLATARAGTLSGAASTLGVHPSTVHRRAAELEVVLRTRVFDRGPRGYALTPAGEELYQHALAIEQEVLAAGRRLHGVDLALEGTVRLTTVDDLAISVLPTVLEAFRAQHPQVEVEVLVGSAFADLNRLEADVALRFGRRPDDPDVVAKRIARIGGALYASRSYLARHRPPAGLEELREHAFVRGSSRSMPMERDLDALLGPQRVAFRSNSMLARLHAVRAGLGVGYCPYFMAEREPELVRLDLPVPDWGAELWLLVHVDLRRNARVRAFVDHAFRALSHDTRWTAPVSSGHTAASEAG